MAGKPERNTHTEHVEEASESFHEEILNAFGNSDQEIDVDWFTVRGDNATEIAHLHIDPLVKDKDGHNQPRSFDGSYGTLSLLKSGERLKSPTTPAELMKMPFQVLNAPGANAMTVRIGDKISPRRTMSVSPTELKANVGIGEWPTSNVDTRTVNLRILLDKTIDLCVTDTVNFETTEKGGDDAFPRAREAVENIFPGATGVTKVEPAVNVELIPSN